MSARFDLSISYSCLSVFWPDLESPFNPWTDGQVAAGFSWRQGSVSFKTPIDVGTCTVEVAELPEGQGCRSDSAIEVPFDAPADGRVEIASISDGYVIEVSKDVCAIRFEVFDDKSVRLTFLRRVDGFA